MPTKVAKPITAWSFSRYRDWRKCPFFFKQKYMLGMQEPGSEAMDRGTAIHTHAENFLRGKAKTLHPELASFSEEFKDLKKRKALAEGEWAFDANWEPVSWFAKAAWVRIKIDTVAMNGDTVEVWDWKTGKFSQYKLPEYEDQTELYVVGALLNFPRAASASPILAFTDEGVQWPDPPKLVKPAALPKLKKKWEVLVKPMFADKTHKPKPGNHCRWCHFRKENGGPCPY